MGASARELGDLRRQHGHLACTFDTAKPVATTAGTGPGRDARSALGKVMPCASSVDPIMTVTVWPVRGPRITSVDSLGLTDSRDLVADRAASVVPTGTAPPFLPL